MNKLVVGAIESASLPDMGIQELNVRVDTGAKTSSLHVDGMEHFRRGGKPWVRFDIHPNIFEVEKTIRCESPVKDIRRIKSSNGIVEERYVVRTRIVLGDQSWLIDISLTDRSEMSFLMLLGREGMGDRILVDPSETFLLANESDEN